MVATAENRSDKSGGSTRQYTISELAAEFDLTARTLRFYEDKGLLAPARKGQSRIYNGRDRAKLKLIVQGKNIGLPLDEIKEMMSIYELRSGQPEQLRENLVKLNQRISFLNERKGDIDQAIKDLKQTCTLVEGLLQGRKD